MAIPYQRMKDGFVYLTGHTMASAEALFSRHTSGASKLKTYISSKSTSTSEPPTVGEDAIVEDAMENQIQVGL